MTGDTKTQRLQDWNRLSRKNAENAIVSSMVEAARKSSEAIDTFAVWILIGSAVIASMLIANAESLLSIVGREGIIVCGSALFLSGAFGLLSRWFARRCQADTEISVAARRAVFEHLAACETGDGRFGGHDRGSGDIDETALGPGRIWRGIVLAFPRLGRRLLTGSLGNRDARYPPVGCVAQLDALSAQGLCAFLQAACLAGCLVAGFAFAASVQAATSAKVFGAAMESINSQKRGAGTGLEVPLPQPVPKAPARDS